MKPTRPRLAWAIAWNDTGRLVHLHGGLSVYTTRREGQPDCDEDQHLARVQILPSPLPAPRRGKPPCSCCRVRPAAAPGARCKPCQRLAQV